jgi:DNA-directed RNA polymerase specialized sigma24 family protein
VTAERAARGREDFEAFYRAHVAELVALAHALAGPNAAYDVAQDTFLAASRRWDQVGELAQPDAWVRDACAARATSRWRRRRRSLLGASGAPDVALELPGRAEELWAEVRSLPGPEARARAAGLFLDPGLDREPVAGAAAVAALRAAARGVDAERGLRDLQERGRRRRLRTAGAVVAGALAVVGAVALLSGPGGADERRDDRRVDPPGSGAVVTNLSGTGNDGQVLVEGGSSKVLLTALRDGTPLVSPEDLEVSPEGDKLALVGDDTLQVVGLGDDRTATSVPCPRCRFVDWMGFKVGILLVTSYGVDGPTTHVYGNDGRNRGAITMSDGISPSGYSPDRLRMVGVQDLGRGDRQRSRLFVLDDTTGTRTPLRTTTTAPGEFIYDVSWSPDGVQVGYIVAGDYAGGGVAAEGHRLMVASADGSGVREVADLGRCYCVRTADPRFAWSPDGSALVAVTVSAQDSRDRSQVRVLSLDGRVEQVLEGGAPVDWGPKAP